MDFKELVNGFPLVNWLQENFSNVRIGQDEVILDCPICGGDRKLSFNLHKRVGRCFRCDTVSGGGHGAPIWNGRANLFQFLAIHLKSRSGAFQLLKERSGLPDDFVLPTPKPKQSLIPTDAIPLDELPDHEPAIQFLKRRGVSHLVSDSYVCPTGYYKERIVLSCRYNKVLVGSECKGLYESQHPKSLFHPPGQFETSKSVYTSMGWKPGTTAVLTESIFDAETWHGITNGLGLYGSSLSEAQVAAIVAMGVEQLIWALDWDAFMKTLKLFRKYALGVFDNYFLNFPKDQDSNSIGTEGCAALLKSAVPIKDEWDLLAIGVQDGGEKLWRS